MPKLLLVSSFLVSIISILVSGENDCSKPPKNYSELKCCEPPKWDDSEIFKQCEKTHGGKQSCVAECALNTSKVIENGEFKSGNLKTLLEKLLKEQPVYIPIALKGFEECHQMLKEKAKENTRKPDSCSPLAGATIECMTLKMFLNCPADKWKSNKDCDEMKDFYSKCTIHIPSQA